MAHQQLAPASRWHGQLLQSLAELLPQASRMAALQASQLQGGIAFPTETLIELHHSTLQFAFALDEFGAGFHQIAEAVHQL